MVGSVETLLNRNLRQQIDASSYRGKPEQAACAFLSKSAVNFVFLAEMSSEYAVRLSDYGTVRSIDSLREVWVVSLSLENINRLAGELNVSKTDDYLDFIRAIILILDLLDFNNLLDYEKTAVSPTFTMKRKKR
jgi:hypothetical protein